MSTVAVEKEGGQEEKEEEEEDKVQAQDKDEEDEEASAVVPASATAAVGASAPVNMTGIASSSSQIVTAPSNKGLLKAPSLSTIGEHSVAGSGLGGLQTQGRIVSNVSAFAGSGVGQQPTWASTSSSTSSSQASMMMASGMQWQVGRTMSSNAGMMSSGQASMMMSGQQATMMSSSGQASTMMSGMPVGTMSSSNVSIQSRPSWASTGSTMGSQGFGGWMPQRSSSAFGGAFQRFHPSSTGTFSLSTYRTCQAQISLWQQIEIRRGKVERVELLGQGAYAEVYKGRALEVECAIKLYRNTASAKHREEGGSREKEESQVCIDLED